MMIKKVKYIFMITLFLPGLLYGAVEKATFAGGCFWCMEHPFEKLTGVSSVVSGYTGGSTNSPTYSDVSSGTTGHLEAVQITYDPEKISYRKLLHVFWRQINPTDNGGQFVDRGKQYSTAIFYHSRSQKREAVRSKKKISASGIFRKPVVTPIIKAGIFYKAEDYHQDYYKKNPLRYKYYRHRSGRDQFLEKTWEKEMNKENKYKSYSDDELKKKLTPLQYKVARENGTEPAFRNEFWDNKKQGIYVDIVSGEALFSSTDKYVSGTGWPSFIRPIEEKNIVKKSDRILFTVRTEVRSANGDSHLGHVFDDGPAPTGLRYCINSASLRFVPKEEMKKEGYGKYLKLFEK